MKMKVPEGCTSCSYDGDDYEVVDGVVTVPGEAVGPLSSHGFFQISEAIDAADEAVEVAVAEKRGKKKDVPDQETPAE